MIKRKIIFGDYDTAADGLWTLTGFTLSPPEYKANFVQIPGRDGDLDLSATLTDGAPRYNDRLLTATFESSEGTREDREGVISVMVNRLDGRRMDIILPDDPAHFITGRVHVAREYNDPAHSAVTVTAICYPWRQAAEEKTVTLAAGADEAEAVIVNDGRRELIPKIVISGDGVAFGLKYGDYTWTLSAGTYKLPDLRLRSGNNTVKYSGTGTATVTYREAVL